MKQVNRKERKLESALLVNPWRLKVNFLKLFFVNLRIVPEQVKNSNRNFHVDSETFERHFKDALEQIISKLKCETINPNTFAAKEIEGVVR